MLYLIQRVEIYDVNGYTVCARGAGELDKYLNDVPTKYILNKDYIKDAYIVLTENEYVNFNCVELEHIKINKVSDTEDEAMLLREKVTDRMYQLV